MRRCKDAKEASTASKLKGVRPVENPEAIPTLYASTLLSFHFGMKGLQLILSIFSTVLEHSGKKRIPFSCLLPGKSAEENTVD